ncbi:aminotransferase class IV, partial [Pedococcus sp.]|uniref:aminotransferase class IV n=1 Tax=Pedococcus sp. TaxID=2860345 RepID=UPI002E109624|nr:aminotransferase class IV [Pedococcus sp.]
MSDIRVWVNGRLTGVDEPAVAALDHGVTVGDGAFETCKVDRGQVFAATRHARRLDRTLAGLGLPAADHDYIAEGTKAALEAGGTIDFGRLRYSVTGGAGPLGSDRDDSALTYIVTAGEQPRPPASATVAVVPWVRNERSAVAGLKTTSYAENVVALAYAKARGAIEAIFANTRDELCEGTGSNIFVVQDGVVLTPPLDSGCLAGITREVTLEWCREEGVPV